MKELKIECRCVSYVHIAFDNVYFYISKKHQHFPDSTRQTGSYLHAKQHLEWLREPLCHTSNSEPMKSVFESFKADFLLFNLIMSSPYENMMLLDS